MYKPEVTCFIVQSNLIPFWEFVERKYQVALSKNLARPKKLGKIARMREEKNQIIVIVAGKHAWKEHGYRMMLIWLHGLEDNPIKELYEGLTNIDCNKLAGKSTPVCDTTE